MEQGSDSGSLPLEDNVLSSILCCFSKYCTSVFLYPLVLRSPTPGHSRTPAHTVICGHCSNVLRPPVVCWDLLDGNCVMQMDAWKIISKCHWPPLVCTAHGQRDKETLVLNSKGGRSCPLFIRSSECLQVISIISTPVLGSFLKGTGKILTRPSLNKLDLCWLPCICIEIKGRQYFCYKNNFLITAWCELIACMALHGAGIINTDCAPWLWAWAYSAGAQPPGEPPEFSPFQRNELYVPFALNMTTV